MGVHDDRGVDLELGRERLGRPPERVTTGRRGASAESRGQAAGAAAGILAEQIHAVLRPGLTETEIRDAAERLLNLAA